MVRTVVRTMLAMLAAVTVAACNNSATLGGLRVDITPDRTQYPAGSPVTLTVRNLGDKPVNYSFCGREVQRLTATGWVSVNAAFASCVRIGLVLEPGASATGRVDLPSTLRTGTYRILLPGVGLATEDGAAADLESRKSSRPFEVTAE